MGFLFPPIWGFLGGHTSPNKLPTGLRGSTEPNFLKGLTTVQCWDHLASSMKLHRPFLLVAQWLEWLFLNELQHILVA